MVLANNSRPKTFDEMVGQTHLLSSNGILTNALRMTPLPSLIFYGPPGTGKTTASEIIAAQSNMPLIKMNATQASITDIKKSLQKSTEQTLLYLDEIQYFNKKQQQSLLPLIENNQITLIAATTENPYHALYDALLSRCVICEFKAIPAENIEKRLHQILQNNNSVKITDDTINTIAHISGGDMRKAVNTLEITINCYKNKTTPIDKTDLQNILPSASMAGFDTDADTHYNLISGLQKSIRGSDPDAAIFYLARLLEGGDLLSPCRRLLVIANEDIGLAYPEAMSLVYALVQTAKELGLPEANKPLTNAVLLLALAPKASTAERTYNAAAEDVKNGYGKIIPSYLRNACSKGYLYPHDYPNHYVKQQYLPDDIKSRKYYTPDTNAFEQNAAKYWKTIKGE